VRQSGCTAGADQLRDDEVRHVVRGDPCEGVGQAPRDPAVTLVAASRRELRWTDAAAYILAQFAFGILGAWTAHLMFGLPLDRIIRNGSGLRYSTRQPMQMSGRRWAI
jgi:glycerol uptake facilitator-like aquaporin